MLKHYILTIMGRHARKYTTCTLKMENIENLLNEICQNRKMEAARNTALCSEFCRQYQQVASEKGGEKLQNVLSLLASRYGYPKNDVISGAKTCIDVQNDNKQLLMAINGLQGVAVPSYDKLLKSLGHTENGVKFLVDMRADVLLCMAKISKTNAKSDEYANLKILDAQLSKLLSILFSFDLLKIQGISWNSSVCEFVEKLGKYEAVHKIQSWQDAKQRLGPYRRCFAMIHPAMPEEPLVILHVALMPEISSKVEDILKNENFDRIEKVDNIQAAIFYSITSTQKGLQGIDLGNFMIKRVAQEVKREFPHLDAFSSLSPIPQFSNWFNAELNSIIENSKPPPVYFKVLETNLRTAFPGLDTISALDRLKQSLTSNAWVNDEKLIETCAKFLMPICAYYLLKVKRRSYVYDLVGNFHLRNGAVLYRLNFLADRSQNGLRQSFGMMVNYRYYLDETEENAERYLSDGYVKIGEFFTNNRLLADFGEQAKL